MKSQREDNPAGHTAYPDAFDRTIGALHGLPDVTVYAQHRFIVSRHGKPAPGTLSARNSFS
jgi:hypothetical protein